MADWGVLNFAAGLERTHHHFTGVNPDAGFEWMRALSGPTLPVIAQLLLHLKSSIECPLRMILISGWRAEQREDAVAGRLHDVTLVVAHGLDHDSERRV